MELNYDEIDLDNIKTGMSQVRTRKVEEDLDLLVENIRKFGLLEPITVFKKDNDTYELLAGQRRLLAVKKLGWKKIPAIIREKPVDDVQAKVISFVENEIRSNMGNKDVIDACILFYNRYGTVKSVSEELGISEERVRRYIKYSRLPKELKDEVDKGDITMNVAMKATDALSWDGGTREATEKVIELAKEMKKLSNDQINQTVKVGQADPSKNVKEIVSRAKTRTGKKITIHVLDEDYLRIDSYKQSENVDNIEEATYELAKEGLKSTGY